MEVSLFLMRYVVNVYYTRCNRIGNLAPHDALTSAVCANPPIKIAPRDFGAGGVVQQCHAGGVGISGAV